MARTRTTPENRTLPDLTTDRIRSFSVNVEYDENGVVRESINFDYSIEHLDANGETIGFDREVINIDGWPASLKTEIKSIRDKVLVDAEAKGYIGAGTDTNDLS